MDVSTRMVRLRNTVNSKVVVYAPAYGIRREFPTKGSVQAIPFEIVEQLLWDAGFQNMIQTGVLYIDSMEDKIDLGLEEPDTKVPTNIKVLTPEQTLTLLKVKSYDDFKAELSTISREQINLIVDYAVDNNIIDTEKIDLLREITGRDVIKIINRRREQAEAEKVLAAKEAARRNEGEFNSI